MIRFILKQLAASHWCSGLAEAQWEQGAISEADLITQLGARKKGIRAQ